MGKRITKKDRKLRRGRSHKFQERRRARGRSGDILMPTIAVDPRRGIKTSKFGSTNAIRG